MPFELGPVLGFRGATNGRWRVAVLLVTSDGAAPSVEWEDDGGWKAADTPLKLLKGVLGTAWRSEIRVPQGSVARTVRYRVKGGDQYAFHVPASDAPPKMAYASCNGFSDPKVIKQIEDKNNRWTHLMSVHEGEEYNLLLLGGDQVYADELWDRVPSIEAWTELPREKRRSLSFQPKMRTEVEQFYFRLYCKRWSQPEVQSALASIPTLMMWDDHDIFDGWGSYDPEDNACPVFQGIFAAARRCFRAFQLMLADGEDPEGAIPSSKGLSFSHVVGPVAIAALDMRLERSQDQVLSPKSWDAFFTWADGLKDCKHLLVMVGIPVVYPDFSLVEGFLGVLPGRQELEDDLKDHWHSRSHRAERTRFVHRLLAVGERGTRVTLLSGDVHVAAVGCIQSDRNGGGNASVINQLTSSAIVHPPPPGMLLFALEKLCGEEDEIDRGITARILEFPGTRRSFIGARNWLAIEPDTDGGRLWANWHVEGETTPYTKVIHPV